MGLEVADLWYADNDQPSEITRDDFANLSALGRPSDLDAERNSHIIALGRRRLPAWARFMVDLGSDIPLLPREEPTTAVVSVPTREFAAGLSASAAVLRYDELEPAAPDDLEEHLRDLRELKPRTRIQYREMSGKVSEGFWRGFELDATGQERFCFEGRKNVVRKLLVSEALRLVPSGEQQTDGQLRVRNVETPHLLRGIRGEAAAVAIVTTARCEVVIVGVATVLSEEICEQGLFLTGDPEDLRHGHLQDLARVQQFAGAHRFYRSVIVSPSARTSDEQLEPRVVIYDGGRMYLQSSHLWKMSHRIVVLDRSASGAEEAALEIAQDYARRRGDSELGSDLTVPDGVEFLAFQHGP